MQKTNTDVQHLQGLNPGCLNVMIVETFAMRLGVHVGLTVLGVPPDCVQV